jgi:hypothetical protein
MMGLMSGMCGTCESLVPLFFPSFFFYLVVAYGACNEDKGMSVLLPWWFRILFCGSAVLTIVIVTTLFSSSEFPTFIRFGVRPIRCTIDPEYDRDSSVVAAAVPNDRSHHQQRGQRWLAFKSTWW